MWKPNVVVLGPGGIKGYLELGSLLKFEQDKFIDQVESWLGCSIGSAISLLKVCGYKTIDIINVCSELDIVGDITQVDIQHILENPGVMSNKSIETILTNRIKQKYGFVPTLFQLYEITKIRLTIVTYNIDKMECEYLSYKTRPELSCVEAVMMSMAIPVIIQPRYYNGHLYIDGAFGDPYPVIVEDNGLNRILGIYIDSEYSSYSSKKKPALYLYRCTQASIKSLRDMHIKFSSDNCKHLKLSTTVIDTTGITLSEKDKWNMVKSGYKDAAIFLCKLKDPDKFKVLLNDNEEIPYLEDIIADHGDTSEEVETMLDLLSNDDVIPVSNDFEEDIYLSDD